MAVAVVLAGWMIVDAPGVGAGEVSKVIKRDGGRQGTSMEWYTLVVCLFKVVWTRALLERFRAQDWYLYIILQCSALS